MATQAEQITSLTEALLAPVDEATKAQRRQNRRTYTQGLSAPERDRLDGARDAERVIAGKRPLRSLEAVATPDYQAGWQEAVDLLLEAFPTAEVMFESR